MQGFTGKPAINHISKSISRKIEDLYTWKSKCDKKQEMERNIKLFKEEAEIQQLQSHQLVSKRSRMYAQRWNMRNGITNEVLAKKNLKKSKKMVDSADKQQVCDEFTPVPSKPVKEVCIQIEQIINNKSSL